MAETIIKIDLKQSPYENENVHNRWHPDIPMAKMVKPGDDFILECHDWTGGQIENNDSADDVRDVDLTQVHFLTGPVGVEGAEPGDLLVVDILDIGTFEKANGALMVSFPSKMAVAFLPKLFLKLRNPSGISMVCSPSPAIFPTWSLPA
jgi:formamidase